jgi:phage tail-like protein
MTEDALTVFRFGLEIEGQLRSYFTKVTGLMAEVEAVDDKYMSPNSGAIFTLKMPGRPQYGDLVLTRGVTSNRAFWQWHQDVVEGKDVRVNCSIVAFNTAGQEVARWNVEYAWPKKVSGPDLDSAGNSVMTEEITLAHGGITRVEVPPP